VAEPEEKDFASMACPVPVFAFASRAAYAPAVLSSVVAGFRADCLLPPQMQELWFEVAEGVPLKWQYPLGALFDLHCGQQDLPFQIKVHFSNAPKGTLPCPLDHGVEADFFHYFKQGMYMRFKSRLPFTEFRENDDVKLWESVAQGGVDDFFEVLSRMKKYEPKAVPVRILHHISDPEYGETIQCRQIALSLDSEMTVRQLVDDNISGLDGRAKIMCQGLQLPNMAKIKDLYEMLASGDLFLYLSIFIKDRP